MNDQPVRVFLVDDQQLVRAGFAMILDATPDMVVAGQAADGQEALDILLGPDAPVVDVVLMDVRMPRLDGVEATRRLRLRPGAPAVVVLTTFDTDEDVVAALRAGASGFLLKDAGPTDLLAGIRAAHRGESVVAPAVTRRLSTPTSWRRRPGHRPGSRQGPRPTRVWQVGPMIGSGGSPTASARSSSPSARASATRKSPDGSTSPRRR